MVACVERVLTQQVQQATGRARKVAVFGATGVVGFASSIIAALEGAQVTLVAHRGVDRVIKSAEVSKQRFGVDLDRQVRRDRGPEARDHRRCRGDLRRRRRRRARHQRRRTRPSPRTCSSSPTSTPCRRRASKAWSCSWTARRCRAATPSASARSPSATSSTRPNPASSSACSTSDKPVHYDFRARLRAGADADHLSDRHGPHCCAVRAGARRLRPARGISAAGRRRVRRQRHAPSTRPPCAASPMRAPHRLSRQAGFRRARRTRSRGGITPPIGLVLGSGFEDRPKLIAALARRYRLIGNDAETIARAKNPPPVRAARSRSASPHPETQLDAAARCRRLAVEAHRRQRRHACRRLRRTREPQRATLFPAPPRRAMPVSVLAVAATRRRADRRRQPPMDRRRRAAPLSLRRRRRPCAAATRRRCRACAPRSSGVCAALGLVGLVAFDFLLAGRRRLYLLEVNPRPSATLDVFDDAERRAVSTPTSPPARAAAPRFPRTAGRAAPPPSSMPIRGPLTVGRRRLAGVDRRPARPRHAHPALPPDRHGLRRRTATRGSRLR